MPKVPGSSSVGGTRVSVSEDVPGQVPSLSEVPPPGLHGQTGPAIAVPNDDPSRRRSCPRPWA